VERTVRLGASVGFSFVLSSAPLALARDSRFLVRERLTRVSTTPLIRRFPAGPVSRKSPKKLDRACSMSQHLADERGRLLEAINASERLKGVKLNLAGRAVNQQFGQVSSYRLGGSVPVDEFRE